MVCYENSTYRLAIHFIWQLWNQNISFSSWFRVRTVSRCVSSLATHKAGHYGPRPVWIPCLMLTENEDSPENKEDRDWILVISFEASPPPHRFSVMKDLEYAFPTYQFELNFLSFAAYTGVTNWHLLVVIFYLHSLVVVLLITHTDTSPASSLLWCSQSSASFDKLLLDFCIPGPVLCFGRETKIIRTQFSSCFQGMYRLREYY